MKSAVILPVLAVVAGLVMSSVFIVDEREKALVLQFGQVKQVKQEPGLGFKKIIGSFGTSEPISFA